MIRITPKVDSEAAEEILRDANISDDVIAGVRALSRGQSVINEVRTKAMIFAICSASESLITCIEYYVGTGRYTPYQCV